VASRYAIKRLAAEGFAGEESDIRATLAAINAELYDTMAAAPSFRGMGTTVAGLLLTTRRAIWFNLGDSRVYRDRGGQLEQISVDHVPPGARSGILTQSLGGGSTFTAISPRIDAEDLAAPSRWLICSDGLSDMLGADEIARAMAATDEEAVRALFLQAMDAGGDDNISIIVVSVAVSGVPSV
jgi:PPM family protein phosphatase